MLLFPNPASDIVSVYMNNGGEYDLNILNIDGSLIRSENTFRDNINLDVSTLSQGIYFVELTDTETKERFVQKLTKL